MRKCYAPEYPRTLGALTAWSGLDPTIPAVTDAAGTLSRRDFQERVLCIAAGLRKAAVGPGKVQKVRLREMAEALLREQRHERPHEPPAGLHQHRR